MNNEMANFNNYGSHMQNLIAAAVVDACEFVNNFMMLETEHDIRMNTSVVTVFGTALNFMNMQLDPDNGDAVLPEPLVKAVREYVSNRVGFKVLSQ